MSRNPSRSPFLDSEQTASIAESIRLFAGQTLSGERNWRDEAELAARIAYRARLGKKVVLSPATAAIVAEHLRTAAAKPTRDEVAMMICRLGESNRCVEPCYSCKATANVVVSAYGRRLDLSDDQEK